MRRSAVFLVATLLAMPTLSAEKLIADELYTEKEFLAVLEESGSLVRSLSENVGKRRADLTSAQTLENPALAWNRESAGDEVEQNVTVSWRPPRPDQRKLSVASAEAQVRAAEATLANDLLALRLELRRAYAEWAVATARAELLNEASEELAALTQRAQQRAESGEAAGLDYRRLRLATSAAQARAALAQADLTRWAGQARAWRPDLPNNAKPSLPHLPDVPSAAGIDNHPSIVALAEDHDAANKSADLARKATEMPRVVLGWRHLDNGDATLDGPLVGLSWNIPLASRKRAATLRADARADAAAARLELQRARIEAEQTSALTTFQLLRNATTDAAQVASDSGHAVEAARVAFQLGESDLTTLLDTLEKSTAARSAALDLHREALAAHREVERFQGSPPQQNSSPQESLP